MVPQGEQRSSLLYTKIELETNLLGGLGYEPGHLSPPHLLESYYKKTKTYFVSNNFHSQGILPEPAPHAIG